MTNAETNDKAATVGEQGGHVTQEKASSKKDATRKEGAPKGRKTAKGARAKTGKKTSAPRAESKGAKILEMIGRAKGATLAEIMKATGWQAHSVRGFLSGTVRKKLGLDVVSAENDKGKRSYSISA